VTALGFSGDAAASLGPFPGLRPFEPEEDYIFFGRERQTDELVRKLRTTRFLTILGRSGSGKSSLVRSGLIPTLWGGGMTMAGSRWRVIIMRPGEDPIGNLAAALSARGALFDEEMDESLLRAFFETSLRASHRGLIECIEQARLPEGNKILVLVDQFEEIFRFKRSRRIVGRDEATAFVKLLLATRESDAPCYIAITMRSDFIGDCMEFGKLPEFINEGIYLVPRMSRDELKAAITGPVGVGNATITPRLVSRLLNDIGDDPDQLPLLQHALMRTWDFWQRDHEPGEGLDLRHYEAIGTLHTALSRHAEEAYMELDERHQKIAEKLFKALTDKASDPRGVRRPVPVEEICAVTGESLEDVVAVVETFRRPGRSFLMPAAGVPLMAESVLDISHESLMRIWDRLSAWADEEARAGQLYLSVAKAAQRHEEGAAALWRDPELQFALTWRGNEEPTQQWASRYDPSFERAMAFLDASKEERDLEVRERDERRRRALKQARMLVVIFSIASLALLALGAYAFVQKARAVRLAQAADEQRQTAVKAQREAERRRVEADVERQRAEAEKARALFEQGRAEKESGRAQERTVFAESQRQIAEQQRVKAETNEKEARSQKAAAEQAQNVAVTEKKSADAERFKAVSSEAETRRLSRLESARALALAIPQQKQPEQRVSSALLALEAYRLYSKNRGDLADPALFAALLSALDRLRPPIVLHGGHSAIRALAVPPRSHVAFAGTEDGSLLRFDLDSGKPAVVSKTTAPIRTVAIAPDGKSVAAGTMNGELRVIDLTNPSAPREIGDGAGAVSSVAFGPTGELAAARSDGTLRMWKSGDSAAVPVTFGGAEGNPIAQIAFAHDRIAAGLRKGGALIWKVSNPAKPERTACAGLEVRSIALRGDGNAIACGSLRGIIVEEDLAGARPPITFVAHRSAVNALRYDASGTLLASAGADGSVRVWAAGTTDPQPAVLPGYDSWVWGVALASDRVISAGEDGTVRMWASNTSLLTAELCDAVKGSGNQELTREVWARYMPPDIEYGHGCPVSLAPENR
jgi:WD40 repeat protein/energy-coupling factor transporter ATP-binding protein EcfA2